MGSRGPRFDAQYEGSCTDCGDGIEPGDPVGYVPDEPGIRCADCADAATEDRA